MQNEWVSKDKVRKLLGFFSSPPLHQDQKAAESNPKFLAKCCTGLFLETMRLYYKSTENQIIESCKAKEYVIRDQIVRGTNNETIHERVMLKNWN